MFLILFVLAWAVVGVSAPISEVRAQGERVVLPRGEARPTTADDLAPRTPTTGTFNERWGYHVLLDGGLEVIANLSVARLGGLREPTVGAEIAVLGFDGRSYRAAREFPVATHFRFDRAAMRLHVHPLIYFEGAPPRAHRLAFETTKDGVHYEVDLTFSDMTPGLTWGDGAFRLGGETLSLFVHIPRARVTGTVAINGERRVVRGTGYMDHVVQTTFAPRLLRGAFRVVQHEGMRWEVAHVFLPAARFEDRPLGFGVRGDAGRTTLLRPRAVEVVHTRRTLGADVPGQLRLVFEDGSETILTRRTDRQAFSALGELSAIERAVVRRVVGGEAVHVRGTGAVGGGGRAAFEFVVGR